MPTGRYTVMDGDGNPVGTEDFRCAPGPLGWRYVSTIQTDVPDPHTETVDLVVDSGWRPVRARIDTGRHELVMAFQADRVTGIRDGGPTELQWDRDRHLDYLSPAFNAATTRRLKGSAEIDVLYLEPVTCEPILERQRYEYLGDEEVATPVGPFRAQRWRYVALRTGWASDLWVAGDVVVRYDGLYELTAYEPGATGPAIIG